MGHGPSVITDTEGRKTDESERLRIGVGDHLKGEGL